MTTRQKIGNFLQNFFGWGVFTVLVLGGLTFFAFLVALLIGGGEGSAAQAIAVFVHKTFFPWLIRATSVIIGLGLVGMYFKGESALSITSDKKEAEDELQQIKENQ